MTEDFDRDLAALFEAENEALHAEPFTQSVMSRIGLSSVRRKLVLGAGSVVGAVAAAAILPSGLIGATENIGQFKLPEISLATLSGGLDNPYWILAAALGAGAVALIASWSLESSN